MKRSVLLYLPDSVKAQLLGHALESQGLIARFTLNLQDFKTEYASGKHQIGVLDLPSPEDRSNGVEIAALAASNPIGRIVIYTRVLEPRLLGYLPNEIPKNVAYINAQDRDSIGTLLEAIWLPEHNGVPHRHRQHLLGIAPLSNLSNAQVHLLRCIANGKSNSEIAELRNTTIRAVENLSKRTIQALGIEHSSMSAAKILASRIYFEAIGAMLPHGLNEK